MHYHTKNNQSGVTLIFSLPLIIALIVVVAFILTLSFRARERSRLQVASDTSAQAAAAVMCSSKECWETARQVAIDALKLNAQLGDEVEFSATEIDPSGATKTHWQSAGYTIDIMRGQWLPQEGFISLENTWQSRNPGKPRPVIQNAVRVEIQREILPLIHFGISGALVSSGKTTALAQRVQSVCAAPFAIPACALVDETGEISEQQACLSDRLFTAVNRYCPAGSDCHVMPDFDYDPFVSPPGTEWRELFQDAIGTYAPDRDLSCFYPTPRYKQVSDNFGVIGLPGSTPATPERVQLTLMQPGGCSEATIGQSYSILPEGLTTPELGDAVWSQITNTPNGEIVDETHLPYSTVSTKAGFTRVNQNVNYAFSSDDLRSACEQMPLVSQNYGVRPSFGICNSKRTDFGNWSNYSHRSRAEADLYYCPYSDTLFDRLAWRVQIPVIAEPGQTAESCAGTSNSHSDPLVDPSKRYEIVGFVTAVIFDEDIGAAPPSLSDMDVMSHAGRVCSELNPTYGHADQEPPPPASDKFPFGFVGSGTTATPCNLVRARLDCNSALFATAFDTEKTQPIIVE